MLSGIACPRRTRDGALSEAIQESCPRTRRLHLSKPHHFKTTRTNNQTAAKSSAPFNHVDTLCPRSNAAQSPAARHSSKCGISHNQAHNTATKTTPIAAAEPRSRRTKNPAPLTPAPTAKYPK